MIFLENCVCNQIFLRIKEIYNYPTSNIGRIIKNIKGMSAPDQKDKKKDCPEIVCEKADPLGTYRKYAKQQTNVRFKDEDEEKDDNTSVP